jgi:CDP-diacylglycerol--glycerol-3-phosphate 3-phosphatidyltransferase/cardiolipin synthase
VTYRARDLLLVPGILSLTRVPLAIAFPFVASRPYAALALLVTAGLTDVLDGFWARRFDQATPTGAVIDPITDKLFVASVVVTLLVQGRLRPLDLVLLSTREIGELPLVVWFVVSHASRKARAEQPLANLPGKTATLLQFVTVAVALFGSRYLEGLLVATAIAGGVAAIAYWWRELKAAHARMSP